jgi:hypothetical protein
MNKLTLIHTKDKFDLRIDGQEVKSVSRYRVSANADYPGLLELELTLKLEVSEIRLEQGIDGHEIIKAINKEMGKSKTILTINGEPINSQSE